MGIKVTVGQTYTSYRPQREKELVDKIQNGLKRTGYAIEGDAKQMCRVDTGRLMSSISTNWSGSGMAHGRVTNPAKPDDGVGQPTDREFTVVVGTNVEYASFVEH